MKLKKQDILLLAALLAGVLLLGAFLMLTRKSGAEVVVKVAGEQVTSISLDKDTKYTIHGVNGGTNELVIARGSELSGQAVCASGQDSVRRTEHHLPAESGERHH